MLQYDISIFLLCNCQLSQLIMWSMVFAQSFVDSFLFYFQLLVSLKNKWESDEKSINVIFIMCLSSMFSEKKTIENNCGKNLTDFWSWKLQKIIINYSVSVKNELFFIFWRLIRDRCCFYSSRLSYWKWYEEWTIY